MSAYNDLPSDSEPALDIGTVLRGFYNDLVKEQQAWDDHFDSVEQADEIADAVDREILASVTIPYNDTEVDYKFDEDKYLEELFDYISSTYGQHYSLSKIQSTEFIMDAGHGEGFTIGNIIKYAQRYGKKEGKNRKDLLKVCHYAIMMLYVHDTYNTEENA